MNFRTLLIAILLMNPVSSAALAQTRIGLVTLTPATPVAVSDARSGYAWQPVPSGMNELRGRVLTPVRQALPAGSRVQVAVIELGGSAARVVADATFSTTRLPTTYQLFYSQNRLQSGRSHAVRCTVTDRAGRVLYRSADTALPRLPRAVLDLAVLDLRGRAP
ncbi:YbaY family lipoprotein [uncultured Deinococcus sp.]|uniref:YbaY family lipoprotein n=1 Tax=uncultured Deinococcus sp. TaxID=158789 RepID=UPI0025D79122|nr:YbaY family lipoprotein [uncultured Deinococcus sp.]